MAAEKKEKKKSNSKPKETINPDSLDLLNDKLDQTIKRLAELESKIEKLSPGIQDATGSLNMTLAILRTFQDVTNVATIFSPSKWLMRLRPDVSLDAIERLIT